MKPGLALLISLAIAAVLLAACAAAPVDRFPAPGESIPGSRSQLLLPGGLEDPVERYPAVVMLHTCGGIASHMSTWAARLLREGYAVLIVDSFGPRGTQSVCGNWQVSVDQVAADALAAAEYLRKQKYIDPQRVYAMGFSYGAMAALRLASDGYLKRQRYTVPFRAIASFYPECTANPNAPPGAVAIANNFYYDIATPLHLLLGGADTEARSGDCVAAAQARKGQGQPVSYTVFPGASHAFDQNYPPRGYRYDIDAVNQSWDEVREFFKR